MPKLTIQPKVLVESAFSSSKQRVTLLAKATNASSITVASPGLCRLFWRSVGEILTGIWNWITSWCKKPEPQVPEDEELEEIKPPPAPDPVEPKESPFESSWDDEMIPPSDSDRDNPL